MSIALVCGHCEQAFHIHDKWAGKRIKCPHCQGKLEVPADHGGQALSDFMQWTGGSSPAQGGIPDDVNWYLQTSTGKQYGPVSRAQLDYWQRLGAVTVRSQVLREGDHQWRWASELYPQLAGSPAPVGGSAWG
jgi:uncharacterized protein YbaR (Trm112 family)